MIFQAFTDKKDVKLYPSDLTDAEWEILEPLVKQTWGRPRTHDIRQVLNGIFYLNRTGCQWRALPKDYPDWKICHGYFQRFSKAGIWDKVLERLREWTRLTDEKNESPSAAIIDSQTVHSTQARDNVGYDAGKKKKAESAI